MREDIHRWPPQVSPQAPLLVTSLMMEIHCSCLTPSLSSDPTIHILPCHYFAPFIFSHPFSVILNHPYLTLSSFLVIHIFLTPSLSSYPTIHILPFHSPLNQSSLRLSITTPPCHHFSPFIFSVSLFCHRLQPSIIYLSSYLTLSCYSQLVQCPQHPPL